MNKESEIALLRGIAQNDDARIEAIGESICTMGVGCTAGTCFAKANGCPEMCMEVTPNS